MEPGVESMKLTDILSLDDWVQLETEMNERSGLSANIFNPDGIRITDTLIWVNRLCPEIKANDKGQAFICAVAHQNLAIQAKNNRKSVIEECDAGIVKICVPIFVDDEFLGAACACGALMDDGEVDSFLINKITDMEEEKIDKLSGDIKSIPLDVAESLAGFVEKRLERIVEDYKAGV